MTDIIRMQTPNTCVIVAATALAVVALAGCDIAYSGGGVTRASSMPDVLWEGGSTVTIEVDASHEGEVHASFSEEVYDEEYEDWETVRSLEAVEKFSAGAHTFTVEVPRGTSAYLQIDMDDPPADAWLEWSIAVDGRTAWEESDQLDGELEKGYAFFLNVEFEDLGAGQLVSGGLWD